MKIAAGTLFCYVFRKYYQFKAFLPLLYEELVLKFNEIYILISFVYIFFYYLFNYTDNLFSLSQTDILFLLYFNSVSVKL